MEINLVYFQNKSSTDAATLETITVATFSDLVIRGNLTILNFYSTGKTSDRRLFIILYFSKGSFGD